MTCTRCGLHEGMPRRDHAERVLCDQCAQRRPVVDFLNPPPYAPPPSNGNGHTPTTLLPESPSRVASQPPAKGAGWLASPKLRVLDVEQMLATEPPPVPWVVEPLLAEGFVTMLAGREGQGKSMSGESGRLAGVATKVASDPSGR